MEELPQVADFDFMVETSLQNLIIASQPLGPEMTELAASVKNAFMSTRALIIYGLANPLPDKDHFVFDQYSEAIRRIVESKAKPPKDLVSHFAVIREAIVSLSFMTVKPAPTQFIRDMIDCSAYYANRVLTENKGVERHMLFVTKNQELFTDLLQYVKKHFLTGFTWNKFPNMGSGGLPPPPPPPPPPAFCDEVRDEDGSGDRSRNALLNDLNQGSNITRMLKPVKRGEQGQGDWPRTISPKSTASGKSSAVKTYPPKFVLEGRKWLVEHIKDNAALVINNESMSESVACYKMENSNVEVKNKINNVTIDNCRKCSISLNSVIACVELVRCDRVQIKCEGKVPLITMDNCESVQIFIMEQSRDVEIISAKCSSCNVCLLNSDGSYKEIAMQEQIKTVLVGEQLVSTVIEKK